MKEKQFWNRILEFAQERLTRSMYDFYATPAELIKVEENTATIFLPRSEMEMVWEKQLKDIKSIFWINFFFISAVSRVYCN